MGSSLERFEGDSASNRTQNLVTPRCLRISLADRLSCYFAPWNHAPCNLAAGQWERYVEHLGGISLERFEGDSASNCSKHDPSQMSTHLCCWPSVLLLILENCGWLRGKVISAWIDNLLQLLRYCKISRFLEFCSKCCKTYELQYMSHTLRTILKISKIAGDCEEMWYRSRFKFQCIRFSKISRFLRFRLMCCKTYEFQYMSHILLSILKILENCDWLRGEAISCWVLSSTHKVLQDFEVSEISLAVLQNVCI